MPRIREHIDGDGVMHTAQGASFFVEPRVRDDAEALDERGLPARVAVPTLLVHGTADDVIPLQVSEWFFGAMSDPRKQLWVVPDGDPALGGLLGLEEADRAAVIRAGRAALGDPEEGLRPSGALILAEVADTDSIPELSRALTDPTPLVARAASRALARIGSVEPEFKGKAARALTSVLNSVDPERVRPSILKDLQALAGKNYGDDIEEWVRYAQKLP